MEAKSGYFLSGDVIEPILYLDYYIQEGNLDACSVDNIPRRVLGTRVNLDTGVGVDGQIRFESGYVWTSKILNPERKICGFKNIWIRVDGP